jgi:hypothetical protein
MPQSLTPDEAAYLRFVAAVAKALGPDFKTFKKGAALRKARADGHDVILFQRIWDHQPDVEVALIVGRSFPVVERVHKKIGVTGTICQIQQSGENLSTLTRRTESTRWRFSAEGPSDDVVNATARSVCELGQPFFERFSKIRVCRDALTASDPWCSGGHVRWANVLALDLALDDYAHFRKWSEALQPLVREQAELLAQAFAGVA